ncbi:MAG: 23S rRNA (adenine(2503)-C(2))-methyltransferase RlmN [Dehalococcoidales bacterium]|nr:23S rRNA (adenine(2503)-C(2))-methyltransferase RlmN [Dehalococcoidales bacterium]
MVYNKVMKTLLTGLDTGELRELMKSEGLPAFRGTQLSEWIYRHAADSFEGISSFPASLRSRLSEKYALSTAALNTIQHASDGTTKLLLEMHDGARIETVALPYPDRFSCCISTQAGCPIGCLFCASGKDGFARNLTAGEIVGQVLAIQRLIDSGDIRTTKENRRIDHVVFMGMGEPLLNYDSTLKAVRLLNTEMGIAIRNLTISTVGIVPEIYRLAGENLQVTLAISLHAPNNTLRKRLIPGLTRWNLHDITEACRDYIRLTGRRVTFEYCMLEGINDSLDLARELVVLLRGLNCHVNLIRFNPVPGLKFQPSAGDTVHRFREILENSGIQVTQRLERGSGINAACGQLRQVMKSG